MLSFLKPKMHVGMQHTEGSNSVILTTYTADEFAIAQDASKLVRQRDGASQLASKNPSVRAKLDSYTKIEADAALSKDSTLRIISQSRTSFGTVNFVGDDYVLIDLGGTPSRRRIIPKASIGRIGLDGEVVRFHDFKRR